MSLASDLKHEDRIAKIAAAMCEAFDGGNHALARHYQAELFAALAERSQEQRERMTQEIQRRMHA